MVATMSSSPLPHALTSIAPPPDLSSTSAAVAAAEATSSGGGGSFSASPGGSTAAAAPTPGQGQHHDHDHRSAYASVNSAMHHPHAATATDHCAVPVAVVHRDAHHAPLPEAANSSSVVTSSGSLTMYSTPPGMSAVQSPQTQTSDQNNSSSVSYDYQAYQQGPTAHAHTHAPGVRVAFAPGMYDPAYSTTSGNYPSHTPMASHAPHLPPVPPEAQIQHVSIAVSGAHAQSSLPTSSGAAGDSSTDAPLHHRRHHRVDIETAAAALPEGGDAAGLSLSNEVALVLQNRRDPSSSSALDLTAFSSKLSKASHGELLGIVQQFDTEALRAACRHHVLGASQPSAKASASPSVASSGALAADSRMPSAATTTAGGATAPFPSFHPAAAAANDGGGGTADPYGGGGGDPTAVAAAGAAALPPPPPPPMAESQSPVESSSDNGLPPGVWYNSVGRFVCRQCNKDFASLSRVNAHLKVHSNRKPHACPSCDRRFARKHHMRDHVLTVHQNYKPFECPHCFRSFGKRSTLIRHIATHTESKIPCPVKACPRTFRDQKTMQNHLSTHRMPHPAAVSPVGSDSGTNSNGGPSPSTPSGLAVPAVPFHAPIDVNGYAPSPNPDGGGDDAHRHPQHHAHHHPPAPPITGGSGSGLPLVPGGFVPMPAASGTGSGPPPSDTSSHRHHQQQAGRDMKHYPPPRSPYEQFSAHASAVHPNHHRGGQDIAHRAP